MAPWTRSASKGGPQVLWFGEENADQDLRIRLVSNKVDDDHTLALFMVHSSHLEKYSTYFSARFSPRWESKRKRNPDEIPFHVMGDVELYKGCFSRMYNPLETRFKSVRYSLELLDVATHLGYDDLMSSICLCLASICPWTYYEEMRIPKAVSSGAFPRGHAKDLLERLERCLPRDDLRSLVTRCMKSLQPEGSTLLHYLLETAGMQERGAIPTFEQDMTTIIPEEFNLLHVETKDEVEKKEVAENETAYIAWGSIDEVQGMFSKLEALVEVYEIMLSTGTEVKDVESIVKCKLLSIYFLKYLSFATVLDNEVFADESFKVAIWVD